MANDEFLTPQQVVTRWNGAVTLGTLANWRHKKKGPGYQKFGTKVRYPLAAVEAYERENAVNGHANDNTPDTERIAS